MSSLSFLCLIECCAHERRSKNIQNNVLTCPKTPFSIEPLRNLQNLCSHVHGMRRKT